MAKMHYPAADRNHQVIGDVLQDVLPASGTALEIASGTGQHIVAFARRFPKIAWQPSDLEADALRSIEAYRQEVGLANIHAPHALNVSDENWPLSRADFILCSNMVHISPWAAAVALMEGAGRLLETGRTLMTYGPYNVGGEFTSQSNQRFDASLRQRNPSWGVRNLEDMQSEAAKNELELVKRVAMPANNFSLIFEKR